MAGLLLLPFAWTGFAAFAGIAAHRGAQPAFSNVVVGRRTVAIVQAQPSQWAQDVLLASFLPLAWMAAVGPCGAHRLGRHPSPSRPVWVVLGAASMAVGVRQWSLGLGVIAVCMGFGRCGWRPAPASWWLTDALAWLPVAAFARDGGRLGRPAACDWSECPARPSRAAASGGELVCGRHRPAGCSGVCRIGIGGRPSLADGPIVCGASQRAGLGKSNSGVAGALRRARPPDPHGRVCRRLLSGRCVSVRR